MGTNLSEEQRRDLEAILAKAEPYTDEEFDAIPLDGKHSPEEYARMLATGAKRILEGKI